MTMIDEREWLFFVIKEVDGHNEIIDSYTDPIEAAERSYNMNEAPGNEYYFLEARPVIATIECESAELNPDPDSKAT